MENAVTGQHFGNSPVFVLKQERLTQIIDDTRYGGKVWKWQ
jgi:hypothetical protein